MMRTRRGVLHGMTRTITVTACVMAAALFVGCQNTMWWEYRDDPYIADVAGKGRQEVLRNVNSSNKDERQMALRILAVQAGQLRTDGRTSEARELEDIILRRYFIEKDHGVQACIVRICAPAVGRGSTKMVVFLRDRIAAGEFPGYAALSLAYLRPKNVLEDIEPLTRHPAPEVRLQAAEALCILGDPYGYKAVVRVWKGMRPAIWPEKIEGVSLAEARAGLEQRAERGFGKRLAE